MFVDSHSPFMMLKMYLIFVFVCSGKLARLTNLASPTSVSFRQGTNVEFNSPGFNQTLNGQSNLDTNVPPLEGYSLEAVTNKSRDFSNPMYDAVQSGATVDTTLSNRSGN